MPIPGYLCGSISIHAPRWKFYNTPSYFNPRSPHGERRDDIHALDLLFDISIHAPAWGATTLSSSRRMVSSYFNPRPPHGERHLGILLIRRPGFISIHAPAWGATWLCLFSLFLIAISIHAPVWGATVLSARIRATSIISIHAPAWGATVTKRDHRRSHNHFNPRSRMGSDRHMLIIKGTKLIFQSTLPHGERPRIRETGGSS